MLYSSPTEATVAHLRVHHTTGRWLNSGHICEREKIRWELWLNHFLKLCSVNTWRCNLVTTLMPLLKLMKCELIVSLKIIQSLKVIPDLRIKILVRSESTPPLRLIVIQEWSGMALLSWDVFAQTSWSLRGRQILVVKQQLEPYTAAADVRNFLLAWGLNACAKRLLLAETRHPHDKLSFFCRCLRNTNNNNNDKNNTDLQQVTSKSRLQDCLIPFLALHYLTYFRDCVALLLPHAKS